MTIEKHPSPNYNSDRIITPTIIVMHWTAGAFDSSVSWLCKPEAQVSAHFVVNRYGDRVYQLVDLNRRAWHCNPSWHPLFMGQQINGLNSYSIGIEIEGPPSVLKWGEGWSAKLISKLAALCVHIKSQCPTVKYIVDHSTISPQLGKSDVLGGSGIDRFPWSELVSITGLEDIATPEARKEVRIHFGLKG